MHKMNKLTVDIRNWASERGLHKADPSKQVLKLGEEYGELCEGFVKNDFIKAIDSIGDMYVVLTILTMQMGMKIEDCVQLAYNEIKGRKGKMVNGIYIKEEDLNE